MKNVVLTIFILMMLPSVGCVRSLTHIQKARKGLMDHPKGEVRYPARVGDAAGSMVGFPACFVLLPVTIPLGHCLYPDKSREDAERRMWFLIYPAFYCQCTGTMITGGVPYLLFGWWGVNDPVIVTENQLSDG